MSAVIMHSVLGMKLCRNAKTHTAETLQVYIHQNYKGIDQK
ncbi:hypothetical protein NRI_0691 [Neorickettsia risticii str. Illinois]|uniref:Uncharacterized protein n=1 Tax=Neorickettsia risticii (strain Illinois) TaxID=434131 RepID=C6V5J8_NEORI|nr:hypothetical protein NRI_0691 [Neorickettsia risticii str. Illinois]